MYSFNTDHDHAKSLPLFFKSLVALSISSSLLLSPSNFCEKKACSKNFKRFQISIPLSKKLKLTFKSAISFVEDTSICSKTRTLSGFPDARTKKAVKCSMSPTLSRLIFGEPLRRRYQLMLTFKNQSSCNYDVYIYST